MSEEADNFDGEVSLRSGEQGPVEGPELESVMHLMWDRIEALERGRRAMRRAIAAGAVVAVVALAVLSARSSGERSDGAPLVLHDLAGRVRARLEVDPQGDQAMLRLFAVDGSEQVTLTSSSAGPTLTLASGKGDSRMRLGMDTSAPLLEVVDKDGVTERGLIAVGAAAPPAAPTSPARRERVREASTRGSTLWFPPDRKSQRGSCRPGTLGCDRLSRLEMSSR